MKRNKFNVMGWSLALASLMLGACTSNGGKTFVDPLAAHIDTTVRAQDDFWTFANGTWLKENPIPASEKENGIFTAVADTVREQVLEICKETSSKEYPEGSNEQKVGDLYFSGMDSVALNTKGISDLKDDLDWLDQMGNFDQFNAMVAYIN
ncbi:MAG: M13 family peptidase, partial [Phocaeicola sp.]|nr:M13 family peptidase [Phocaeicola sp.]